MSCELRTVSRSSSSARDHHLSFGKRTALIFPEKRVGRGGLITGLSDGDLSLFPYFFLAIRDILRPGKLELGLCCTFLLGVGCELIRHFSAANSFLSQAGAEKNNKQEIYFTAAPRIPGLVFEWESVGQKNP